MTSNDLNQKYGPFCITRYDANREKSVAIPGHVYPTMEEAAQVASRLEQGKRYAGKPMLMVDSARFYAA